MRVAIVGAGIVGLSAAHVMARRGHAVTVYEQFPLFHDRGSSHGRTRIVRRAYPSHFWTGLMEEAYPLWAQLEEACSEQLVTECGLLYFGNRDAPRVLESIAALEALAVPHQVLSASECVKRLSGLALAPDEVGIFTPEAGFVRADRALIQSQALASSFGATFVRSRANPLALQSDFDVVILAAGGWVTQHVPGLDVVVTRQTFAYAQVELTGAVWIDDTTLAYGFPTDESGAKMGAHEHGPITDPDREGAPHQPHVAQIRATISDRFGDPQAELRDITTCIYSSTPDEMFRMGWLTDQVLYASACSGHGFKLGPWVGRKLADVIEGASVPAEFQK